MNKNKQTKLLQATNNGIKCANNYSAALLLPHPDVGELVLVSLYLWLMTLTCHYPIFINDRHDKLNSIINIKDV